MKKILALAALLMLAALSAVAQTIDQRVDALLAKMTMAEKVGQLNQRSAHWAATGPVATGPDLEADIRAGKVGSILNAAGVQRTRHLQDLALQSRLRIPLIFGLDVIHGYQTTFPIPLAEAASWDLAAIEKSARIAATEAAAAGVHWTFAPMVDIARDPRWGRVLEGAGEDTFLGAKIATARVRGFQGAGLGQLDAVMATAKHFAGYGAALAGRDYNTVDMSERMLREAYLPPFKAALDAGAATFMNAFNDLNGVPATGSTFLQRQVLKGEWGFTGFVVSDWSSIAEMIPHGFARDLKDAGRKAFIAGNDMDMESNAYTAHLPALMAEGAVPPALLDDAVRRVLRKKFELGLFDDAQRFADTQRERTTLATPANRQAARAVASASIVLLKNEGGLLPLAKTTKTIAFIGPLVKAQRDNLGAWAVEVPGVNYEQFIVSQWDGVRRRLDPGSRLLYAKGSEIDGDSRAGFDEAVAVARQADVVVLSLGEGANMSGEARSRTRLGLPGVQDDLARAIQATGKPVVVLINAGRPLIFNALADSAPAILYTWWLGSEAGDALADVLFGDVNPSAKLPITFPRSEGQIPLFYNHPNTGRPASDPHNAAFGSRYVDLPNTPRFAFGHGLSYTQFAYSRLAVEKQAVDKQEGGFVVSLQVRNTGQRAGAEVVQLYLRQRVASVVRPVQELKGFGKVLLAPGETKMVRIAVPRAALAFVNSAMQWVVEPGEVEVMLGSASDDIRLRGSLVLE